MKNQKHSWFLATTTIIGHRISIKHYKMRLAECRPPMWWKWYDVRIVSIGIENCQRTVELNILISAIARKVFTVMVIIGSALTGKGEMMPRYIDADALWMDIIHNMDYCEDILEFIEAQPTTDVVEVVRCKECKYWHREIHNGIEYFNYSSCDLNHYGDGHNFYCADGERKDGGAE